MFRNKMFLYGLGTGLIIASLLLQLLSLSSEPVSGNEEETLQATMDWEALFQDNWDELNKAAQQFGYALLTEEELSAWREQAAAVNDETAAAMDDGDDEAAADETQDDETTDLAEPIVLMIEAGLTSMDVSRLLEQLSLVDDQDTFEQMLVERQLTTRIQMGTYVFDEKPDPEELIAIITK